MKERPVPQRRLEARERIRSRRAVSEPRRILREQQDEELRAAALAGRRVPAASRITVALDLRGLHGPQVDRDLGVYEPAVDEWEAGTRVPTLEQVERLAVLTDFPWSFFYSSELTEPEAVFICPPPCERAKRKSRTGRDRETTGQLPLGFPQPTLHEALGTEPATQLPDRTFAPADRGTP